MRPPEKKPTPEQEPLFPPWITNIAVKAGPPAGLLGLYFLLTDVLHLPPLVIVPVLVLSGIGALVYFGGRFYKPFQVNAQGKCIARNAEERVRCRHFMLGAKLGTGCGRHMENGGCRMRRI